MTFVNLAHVAQQVLSSRRKVPFRYKPRRGVACPGTLLWPRSKEKWAPNEYWDSPLKALARRFASSSLVPLTKCERAIMRELADKCNRKLKYAFCGLKHLMTVTSFSRRGIQNALQNLERKGFLVIDRSQKKYKTNMYYLMFDAMENALAGTPWPPSDPPIKYIDFVVKNQKVHPNICKYINILPTLRSWKNAFENTCSENLVCEDLRLPLSADRLDLRYKKVVETIQVAAIRHSGNCQQSLFARYLEIVGNSPLDDELKKNLHHNDQLIVNAVIFLLMRLRNAASYIYGSLTELITNMDGSNVIRP